MDLFNLILLVFAVASLLFIFRTQWVHNARMKVLNQRSVHRGLYQYEQLPSFKRMVWMFWIWDIKRFQP